MRSRGSRDVPVVNELHEPPEIVKDGGASQEMESLSPRHAVSSTDSQATIDIDEEKNDIAPRCSRCRVCCCVPCRDGLFTASVTSLTLYIAVRILDSTVLWEQRGATSIAPPAIAIAVLLAGICTEALRYAYLARQHRIVRSVRRAPSRYKALRAALPCLRSACQLAWGIGSGVGFFFLCVWLSRTQSGEHLDDLHPTDGCSFLPEYRTHDHARFLWLIPIHDGVRMSADRSWCEEMMRLERDEGMALGMHGVLHQMRWRKDNVTGKWVGKREFEEMPLERARKRVALGVEVWKEAFNGSAPRHFSFPGQWGSAAIVEMLEKEFGMSVRSLADGMLQRVYHCDDSWCDVFCKAWFNDII